MEREELKAWATRAMAGCPVTVLKLGTGEEQVYCGISPKEAVIAAHAQSRNDWNAWDYAERYGELVVYGKRTVSCGDFCALTSGG